MDRRQGGVFSRSRQRRGQAGEGQRGGNKSGSERGNGQGTSQGDNRPWRGSAATGTGSRTWSSSLNSQRRELNQWNEVLHKLEQSTTGGTSEHLRLDGTQDQQAAPNALSTGDLNELLDKLFSITYPCSTVTADGCGTMISLLCSAVPPTNDDLCSKLCQFVCTLSSRQQQVMCRRNQLDTILDFLIAYTSRCSSFFVKESLKAMGFILHEHGHKCGENGRSILLLELLLPYISLSQVDLEAKQAAMHCLANLLMHAHLKRLFNDRRPRFFASNSNDDRSDAGEQDRNQQYWNSAEDLIYENLKQHSCVASRDGNTDSDGDGICRILISTLRAVTGMVAMGGYASSSSLPTMKESEPARSNTEQQTHTEITGSSYHHESEKGRVEELMTMLKGLLVFGVEEDKKGGDSYRLSSKADSTISEKEKGPKSPSNLM